MIEGIKGNLLKGGLGFSKMFPAMGSVLGAAFTFRILDTSFPKLPKRKR